MRSTKRSKHDLTITEFKRNTRAVISRLRRDGKPLVVVARGKGRLVVQDVDSYRELIERIEAVKAIAGIDRALGSRTKKVIPSKTIVSPKR